MHGNHNREAILFRTWIMTLREAKVSHNHLIRMKGNCTFKGRLNNIVLDLSPHHHRPLPLSPIKQHGRWCEQHRPIVKLPPIRPTTPVPHPKVPPGGLPDVPIHLHKPMPCQAQVDIMHVSAPETTITIPVVFDSSGRGSRRSFLSLRTPSSLSPHPPGGLGMAA